MRHPFGWSLSPGCSTLPGEEPIPPCEVCGRDPEGSDESACICPECPACQEFGNPKCYDNHGLVRTQEQIESLAKFEKEMADTIRAENEYFASIPEEEVWE